MTRNLFGCIHGYLVVYFKAQKASRFFNICHYKKIPLWDICMEPETNRIRFSILAADYKRLQPVLRKLKHAGWITEKKGLYFWWVKKKKQPFLFVGLCCYFFLLLFLSSFLLEIRISGGEKYTQEYLVSLFQKEGIVCAGQSRSSIRTDQLKRWLRNQLPDIGWVNATLQGSVLYIELVEVEQKQAADTELTPVHLVAPKDGVIASIVTRAGTPLVKKGDAVSKGAILVSGFIEVRSDDDVIVSSYAVHADADILLDSEYTYQDSFSLQYQKKVKTKEKKTVLGIGYEEHYLYLTSPFSKKLKASGVECIEQEHLFPLTKNFFFPLRLRLQTFQGYEWETAQYTKQEAFCMAENRLNQIIEKFKKKGVLILDNNVKISLCGKKCVSKGSIRLLEPVHTTRSITPEE